jgi:nitroreductase
VWVGAFDEDAVRAAIGGGHDLRPVAFLPIGYAAETPEHRSRRTLSELVHRID